MSKGLLALLASLVAIALVAAGCGSGSDTTGSTEASESSLTKAEFVKKADAICKEGGKNINAEFEEFTKEKGLSETKAPPKPVEEEAVEEILIPSINRQIDEIRALGTPEGDEGELEEVIVAEEEVMEEGEEDPVSLLETTPEQKAANKLAREYGLTVCGGEEDEG